ncbi:uncharacterized protein LOC127942427 [Carassius gibelio]|uniref:uncharacterized protein LOC127942427 n=1 Tax=Carassius gibelio TaxID=101364 RepID=UPI002279E36D|nr:uncharacterized protein LOC127942427 [Carassius gibelio]
MALLDACELHTLETKISGQYGPTVVGYHEFTSVSTLDGLQIDYYDSVTKKLIPKQDWMKEFASTDRWEEYTEIRERMQQTRELNNPPPMRFSPPRGVQKYQRVYGCVWDDETGDRRGFDEYSNDGKDFITLDLKENRYTASSSQAGATVMKWNYERERLDFLKRYYRYECFYFLKELLHFSKASFEKAGKVPESTGRSLTEPTHKILTEVATNSSKLHTLETKISGKYGPTVVGYHKFTSVSTLDGLQIDYYDSVTKKLIPKQDWMKEFASTDRWEEYTEIRERMQQTRELNNPPPMRFSPPRGVQKYQRVYGCVWDDETGDRRGFDEYSNDGKDFITLDLKENRYTASSSQAGATVMKWNYERERLDFLKRYYRYECFYFLKELLHFSKASFEKAGKVPESTGRSLTEPTHKILTEVATNSSSKLKPGSFYLHVRYI